MKSEKEIVLDYVEELKLTGVKDELEDVCALAMQEGWSHMRLIAELRVRTRMKAAKFPQMKYLHELDTEELPDDARKALPELETLDFIREGRNVVLYGNPGTGKTHIATARGIKACQCNHTVYICTQTPCTDQGGKVCQDTGNTTEQV